MPRRQLKNDRAGLKKGCPFPGRGMGNADLVAQALQVEELAHPPCTKSDELFKKPSMADVHELPDVALDIGLEIVRHGLGWVDVHVAQPGVEAMQDQ